MRTRRRRARRRHLPSRRPRSSEEMAMRYTRRDLGRLALAGGAASRLMAAKPNSVFGGVQVGVITYSFRALPRSADEVLQYCLQCGISSIELMSNVAEGYAGSPSQGGRGFGGGPVGAGVAPG